METHGQVYDIIETHECTQTDRHLSRETRAGVQTSVFTVLCTRIYTERCLDARTEELWLDKGLGVEYVAL